MKISTSELERRATQLRRHVLQQARHHGQGYVGQGLQAADIFALLHFGEMNWNARRLDDPERDHFLLSTGHYAIALYATLVEAGLLATERLADYGIDGKHLTLGAEPGELPGIEFAGGSLGQGLGVACGLAMGLKMQKNPARVFNYMSDGEIQEGSVWEAAMLAGARGVGNLINIVDVNRTQADGPLAMEIEPLTDKFRAFGWWAEAVDGNDMAALVEVFDHARAETDKPKTIICHTAIGCGSKTLQSLPKTHFVRIDASHWNDIIAEFETGQSQQIAAGTGAH